MNVKDEYDWGGTNMKQELKKEDRKNEIQTGMIYLVLSLITTLCLIAALNIGSIFWSIVFVAATVWLIAWGLGGILK